MTNVFFILLAIFPALVVAGGLNDLTTMKIPNLISVLIVASFFPVALMINLPLEEVVAGVILSTLALAVGMAMFAMNWIGGGDAKLLSASMLWMGTSGGAPFILYTAIAGGGFCLLLITARNHLPFFAQTGPVWVMRLMQPRGDIPYGVAIAIGALLAYPSSPLMAAFIAG